MIILNVFSIFIAFITGFILSNMYGISTYPLCLVCLLVFTNRYYLNICNMAVAENKTCAYCKEAFMIEIRVCKRFDIGLFFKISITQSDKFCRFLAKAVAEKRRYWYDWMFGKTGHWIYYWWNGYLETQNKRYFHCKLGFLFQEYALRRQNRFGIFKLFKKSRTEKSIDGVVRVAGLLDKRYSSLQIVWQWNNDWH